MRRREFIALAGGAVAWPLAARAREPAAPVAGFLNSGSPDAMREQVSHFRHGLAEVGYVEGRNLRIEYRWAENRADRLPELVADLIRRNVAVIAAPASGVAPLVAKALTTTIPIVFGVAFDPVKFGLVASLNRPEGNLTGVMMILNELTGKNVDVLHQAVPDATTIGFLVNPDNFRTEDHLAAAREAVASLGLELVVAKAGTDSDLDQAFAALARQKVGALLVQAQPSFASWRDRIAALALRHSLPTMCQGRHFAVAGLLMSYGPSTSDLFRWVGVYTGRILKGEKPGDLPVQESTKIEFVINLRTARALKLDIPPTLLALADEVLE